MKGRKLRGAHSVVLYRGGGGLTFDDSARSGELGGAVGMVATARNTLGFPGTPGCAVCALHIGIRRVGCGPVAEDAEPQESAWLCGADRNGWVKRRGGGSRIDRAYRRPCGRYRRGGGRDFGRL